MAVGAELSFAQATAGGNVSPERDDRFQYSKGRRGPSPNRVKVSLSTTLQTGPDADGVAGRPLRVHVSH